MLPFLEPKKMVSVIIARRGKSSLEAKPEVEAPSSEGVDPAIKSAAEDLLQAIDERSVIGIAKALQAAFEIADSLTHEEYHSDEEKEAE